MTFENFQKSVRFMVSLAFSVYFSIRVVEKRQNIHGSISNVFKFLKSLFHGVCSKVWNKPFKDLNSRTLIKEKEMRWRILIKIDQVLHFWEEIRVGNVKKIAGLVRLEIILLQNAMNR